MIKTMLILVTWLQNGPIIQTQVLDSAHECNVIAESTAQMIKQQAKTNLSSPHNDLTITRDEKSGEWRLGTGMVDREVGRLRCVSLELTN